MTREMAIEIFKKQQSLCLRENDWYKALTMAIEALQTEPCENVISRNLVLSTVKSGRIRVIDGEDWKRVMDNASEIRALPSVQPKPKMGRWIESHIPESTLCECSVCGFSCGAYSFNFCPNCGAKMEEGE